MAERAMIKSDMSNTCGGPASVAQVIETQWAPTGTVYRRSRGSIPRVGR